MEMIRLMRKINVNIDDVVFEKASKNIRKTSLTI